MARVGKINKKGFLIGTAETNNEKGKPVDPGDLPLDGSYRWDEPSQQYIPKGYGFPRITERPPYATEFVLARVIEALGKDAPAEATAWKNWYDANLRQRQERG